MVDKKTKGKYTAKLDKVDDMAKKLDKTAKDPSRDTDDTDDGDAPKA